MSTQKVAGHKQTKPNFSRKDQLFNRDKVQKIANEITLVYPEFKTKLFTKQVVDEFPELELKQRVTWIRESLREHLPANYNKALNILLASLPEECDPTLSDNDFGDFIYAPYGDFVAQYGCTTEYLASSLAAIEQMTTRFSCEEAIRYFINAFPKETMQQIQQWTKHPHYHVRRLASEGTRPKLPWCIGIELDYQKAVPILNTLYTDNARYVTRSVANHLNDISKIDPDLVFSTLASWHHINNTAAQVSKPQQDKELQFITKHALRTLIKRGDPGAMQLLGYSAKPQVTVQKLSTPNRVSIGEQLEFAVGITAKVDEPLLVDYAILFNTKRGTLSRKVFKLKQYRAKAGQTASLVKKHSFKVMTTRALYPGNHVIEIQVNGQVLAEQTFQLVS